MSWALSFGWELLPSLNWLKYAGITKASAGNEPQHELQQRLESLSPTIEELLTISGTAGASVGVLHMDKVVYTKSFGFKDVEAKSSPNEDTLYYIASLSKFMTAAGIGTLVDRGKLAWDDLVSKALPEWQHCNQEIREHVNLQDILSHKSGLAPKMFAWMGEHSRPQEEGSRFTKTTTYLEPAFEFGSSFVSNNWLYGIAAQIIERNSGQEFGRFLECNFFENLHMHRTRIHSSPDSMVNFAEAYMYNGDSPYRVHKPPIENGAAMEGAVGVKSSVRDLLTYYKHFLRSRKDQISRQTTSTPGSPFKQVRELLNPQIDIDGLPAPYNKTTYALGWAQTKLPTALGALGGNVDLVKSMPRIGEDLGWEPTVLYHAGSLVGYLSCVMLLPETDSAIVVLSNTLSNQDQADWIGQAFLECLLNVPHPNDYIALAKEAAATYDTLFPRMHKMLAEERIQGTNMRSPEKYVGKFENQVGTFILDIYLDNGDLCLSLNGYRPEKHELSHYHFDTFSFEMTYKDCLTREMWPKTSKNYYLLEFGTDISGDITTITWRPDWAVPAGELFTKRLIPQPLSKINEGNEDKAEL